MSEAVKFERIMIIDDNNIDLYVAARLIAKTGFANEILQYTSARQAVEYLRQNATDHSALPEIILVDIYMPDMSGFEFMAAYDELPAALKSYCQAFIISSSLDESDIDRANSDPNVVAFHEKPINTEFLDNILHAKSW